MSSTTTRLSASLANRYQIERELGQGGMATDYLAEDLRHKRRVALQGPEARTDRLAIIDI